VKALRATLLWAAGVFVAATFASSTANAVEWKVQKGDHFIVNYLEDDKFARSVLKKSEEYYKKIASELGYQRYSDFWQWDNRVKIYLYPDQAAFIEATGRKEWSQGVANYERKEIISYTWEEGFLEALLPHEITHLIFRDYVGFKGEIAVWLDEGVAQWMELPKRKLAREYMQNYLAQGKGFSIKDLTEVDVRNVNVEAAVRLFYVQAISVIDFLINRYGTDRFIVFCRQLRDGKSLKEALTFTYPTSIRTLEELEAQWKDYILSLGATKKTEKESLVSL